MALLAAGVALSVFWLEAAAFSTLDRNVSARGLARQIQHPDQACIGDLSRALRYGLDYYLPARLPDCAQAPRRTIRIDRPAPLADARGSVTEPRP